MVSGLKKIGKYLFLEEQEHGILGAMWRVGEIVGGKIERNLLALQVADELAADPRFRDQYLKQSPITGKLEHPNILRKANTSSDGNDLVSYYEYQEGFSLEKVMKRCQSEMNPFSVDHALLVVSKLLSALAYAKTKHLTHGFVNPSMVFVTHEGEIKLQGFALSSALRAATKPLSLTSYHQSYIPAGLNFNADDRDRLDIFGCGVILYEMLVGETYKGTDAAAAIEAAETAMEGEPIPAKIAHILVNALDNSRPTSYKDIQKMAKDMDELLFSGEYSPTTFNLAFFMHSAFRLEMEELGTKIAAEKERNFSEKSASPPPPAPSTSSATRDEGPGDTYVPPPRQVTPTVRPPKSKTPMILALVAVLLIAIIGVVLFKPKAPVASSNIDKMGEQLAKEGKAQAASQEIQDQEELRRTNEQLTELLREQAENEKMRKKEDLEAEMAAIDKKISEAKRVKEAEEQSKLLQAELEQVKKMLAEKEKTEKAAVKPKPKEQEVAQKPDHKPTEVATGAKAPEGKPVTVPEPKETKPDPVPSGPPVADKTPPQPGELILLSDEFLQRPSHVTMVPKVDVPRKAIKEGLVRKGQTAYFLVAVLVNEKGDVIEAKVHRSPLPINAYDFGVQDEVLKVANKMKFTVPTKLGVPVRVWSYATIHLNTNQ